MNEFAIPHSVSGVIAGVQRGTGEWPFLTDMTDDLFEYAARQQQQQPDQQESVIVAVKCTAARPLPVDVIRESLEIDETAPSGLRWKVRPRHHFETERGWKMFNNRDAGKPAGSRKGDTLYWKICIDYVPFKSHRIVWFLFNGIDPRDRSVDHIRPDLALPNIPSNLRLATHAENLRNQKKHTNNTSGTPGVGWDKQRRKWVSQIMVNYKNIHLGRFNEHADAVAARKAAEVRYFGAFAYDASQNRQTA